ADAGQDRDRHRASPLHDCAHGSADRARGRPHRRGRHARGAPPPWWPLREALAPPVGRLHRQRRPRSRRIGVRHRIAARRMIASLISWTVAFFAATYFITRWMNENGMPQGVTRAVTILVLATALACCVGWLVDRVVSRATAARCRASRAPRSS